MSESERMLMQLGEMLAKIARPYRADDDLPQEVRANLCQLGFPCSELTTREELIARLWARKRSLLARFFDAMAEARMRQAVRELAMHRDLVPADLLKKYGYRATSADDSAYPFTR